MGTLASHCVWQWELRSWHHQTGGGKGGGGDAEACLPPNASSCRWVVLKSRYDNNVCIQLGFSNRYIGQVMNVDICHKSGSVCWKLMWMCRGGLGVVPFLPSSCDREVTPLPSMPQGVMWSNQDSSGQQLRARPWKTTPCTTWMPAIWQKGQQYIV